jgi:hypothetical protein
MTFDEVSLMYGNYINENIAIVSNEQLITLINKSHNIQAAALKQYAKNLQDEKKSNQDILNASLKLDEVMKVNSEKHSKNEVVTLNVGGKFFATFKGTLMNYEHSYFYAMLNSGNFLPGADGSYFIDRDPTHFPTIMAYLRTGELSTKGLKSWQIQELEKELDYYLLQIASPSKSTEWHWDLSPSRKPFYASFSEDDLKITYAKNLQNEKKSNQDILNASLKLDR